MHSEPSLVDCHCHIGLYARPAQVARQAHQQRIRIVAVTNSPSQYEKWLPYAADLSNVDLSLGLHPLAPAGDHLERSKFADLSRHVTFIGEIGLDFSATAAGAARRWQVETFGLVLQSLKGRRHFVSVHSRRADTAVLDMLEQHAVGPVVLHWFSGSRRTMHRALDSGHFFSINPAMLRSQSGRRLIKALPPERVLTETDGPFVKVGNRPAEPSDVRRVLVYLSRLWGLALEDVEAVTHENLQRAFTAGA